MSSPSSGPNSGTLTFLFTDIEGSTARWETQREAMSAALQRHDAILRAAIEGSGGTVFKTVGDAFCAVFASASDALAAALEAQRVLAEESWSAFGPDFADLKVRMGIHHGQAEARAGDYFGPALNRTARLMAAGHGGQVLLSLAAQQVLRDYLAEGMELRDWGEHRLKDLRHSEHLFQLLAPGLADIAAPPVTAEALTARDRVQVLEDAPTRPLPEALAALLAALRSDDDRDAAGGSIALSPEQAREIAGRRPADLTEYRLGRIAEWSQPRYRLDGRFVALTLLVDQGEEAVGGRWTAREERYEDLGTLLSGAPDPALVVLGPPGAGKSTLLRRLELDMAIGGLRGLAPTQPRSARHPSPDGGGRAEGEDTITFFIQLNQYRPERPGAPPPAPGEWLAAEWAERYPDLPPLDGLLSEGRMTLLLDALNEMPAASEREYRERVGLWKEWLLRLTQTRSGNRVVFSCRALDYSAPLSTPALRVPQVQIEPLTDAQVEAFLRAYSPVRGAEIWAAIRGRPQLEALRSPFFLALLVEQVEASGDLAEDRAGILTGFVRQALRREVERGSPLFTSEELLSSRDMRRVTQWQWKDGYELPERGALFPKLSELAYGMQEASADGGASQLRLDLDVAMDLLDTDADEDIVKAGLAIAVLDEDPAADELLYRHQLLQEYFAARILAREPKPELVAAPWRATEIRPKVPELLATLSPADTLPPLPQTGWEETALLAAVMADDAEGFIRGLMATNLVLAGRAAALPELLGRLGERLLDDLRRALAERSRDVEADLRARIAAGYAVGELGDPRLKRVIGSQGAYLLPPMVSIAGGMYPIGDDEPITWDSRGIASSTSTHMPRHSVAVTAFRMTCFPVTNAEYICFVAAGGYEDERWWQTEDARRWLRGEIANEAAMVNNRHYRARFRSDEGLFQRMEDEGGFPDAEALERWRRWITLDDAAFEAELTERWKGAPQTGPMFWRDDHLNRPAQPVVGICWYEARAYAAWLGTQAGEAYRLPTEVEWEAAARGPAARAYAWGDAYAPERCNTFRTKIRRTSPVGVFVEGDSPEGLSDLTGTIAEWTSSLFGEIESIDDEVPGFAYPYHAGDGREDVEAPPSVARVVRGGSWPKGHHLARAACRHWYRPNLRSSDLGFRLVLSSPIAPVPVVSDAVKRQ